MLERGYIQIYTGNGKGKTTAALGLTLRAAGSGLSSCILQFMKGQHSGEIEAVNRLDGLITIEQYGSTRFCRPEDTESFTEHKEFIEKGICRAREVLSDSRYSIVVLDEIITTTLFGLLTDDEILELIKTRKPATEVVLTGRGASERLIAAADLVTEMREIKHYYADGVAARRGIED